MTVTLELFPDPNYDSVYGSDYLKVRREYEKWCWDNLFVPGEAVTYKVFVNRIIFLNNEDCVAFKLRFGL